MVELQHRAAPTPALTTFNAAHPKAAVTDFNSLAFQPVKTAVKTDLNADQGGLCVYCERKQNRLLPIEPGPGCNAQFALSTDGTIEPIAGLTKKQQHPVRQTRDMLGLNADSDLVDERKRWLAHTIAVLQQAPNDIQDFLQAAPYRYMLATAL